MAAQKIMHGPSGAAYLSKGIPVARGLASQPPRTLAAFLAAQSNAKNNNETSVRPNSLAEYLMHSTK